MTPNRLIALLIAVITTGLVIAATSFAQETPPAGVPPTPTLPPTATGLPVDQVYNLPISQDVEYIVRPRDNFDLIAALFDVQLECLASTNNLDLSEIIRPGDILVISVDCPAYFGVSPVSFPRLDAAGRATPSADDGEYVVRPNDTIDTIGQALNISVQAILQANDISDPRSIVPGQVLIIPEGAPAYGVFPPNRELSRGANPTQSGFFRQPPATGAAPSGNEYVVQPNDTLDTIGQALNVSVDALRIANGIDDPNSLLPGQVLVIPENAPAYGVFPAIRATGASPNVALTVGENEYVVQPNDTLDTIGQALNVSVEAIRIENNISDPNLILPGLVLTIPEDAPPYGVFPAIPNAESEAIRARIAESGGEEYVVQPNDTLDTIAQAFNVSVVALRVANEIDSALDLRPGQVLIIPANAPVYGVYASINEPAGSQVPPGEQYILQPGDTLDQIAAEKNIDTLCLIEQNGIDDPRYIRAGQIIGIPAGCPPYTGLSSTPFRTAVPLPPGGVPTTAPQVTPTATPPQSTPTS